jgi:hypothetical protein
MFEAPKNIIQEAAETLHRFRIGIVPEYQGGGVYHLNVTVPDISGRAIKVGVIELFSITQASLSRIVSEATDIVKDISANPDQWAAALYTSMTGSRESSASLSNHPAAVQATGAQVERTVTIAEWVAKMASDAINPLGQNVSVLSSAPQLSPRFPAGPAAPRPS